MPDVKDRESGATEHHFQAEVSRVLDIVIHSLYSHREIFLRELISNAADAIDRLRFRAVTEHDLLGDQKEMEIRLVPDKDAGTLTIEDDGVGMAREELVENLGTIARSGTRKFLEMLKQKGQGPEGLELIGQFGVGFYSAFIVADKVEVTSRAAGAGDAWTWSSAGSETFTVAPAPERTRRGTSVRLHLKEDAREFLDDWKLRGLVRKYSDFVSFPIRLQTRPKEGAEPVFETVNRAGALWRRPKNEIKDEDYAEFYKHVAHDWEAPLERIHFTVEGTLAFTGLLFVPRRPPPDIVEPRERRGLRLYVKRVFIMEDCEVILPGHLRFLRGIVDSDDLPLNVSRELLQEDRVVRSIRKTVTGKVISALEQMAEGRPDDYRTFWNGFGAVFKEGVHTDHEHRERLARLLRWPSTKEEFTSLAAYKDRMPESQEAIYYATGLSRGAVEKTPHLEGLAKKGFEVIMMSDPIDEWVVQALREFDGKKLVSALEADLALEADESAAAGEAKLSVLEERAEKVLEDVVSEVRVSTRLVDSPCCLVVAAGGIAPHIERLLRAQGQDLPSQKRILELNPRHPLIERLAARCELDPESEDVTDWLRLLYDQALLAEGSPISDPQRFARRIATLMAQALDERPPGGPPAPAPAAD